MDPKILFEQQMALFLKEFDHAKDWSIKRDTLKNVLGIVPSEWFLHSQYRGAFYEFALNVKGEIIFALGVENPIPLENRVEFKKRLYEMIEKQQLLKANFDHFEINLEQRGKFIKKTIPMLTDSYKQMLQLIDDADVFLPIVKSLIDTFKAEGKILNMAEYKPSVTLKNIEPEQEDLEYDEGDPAQDFEYCPERKIFTQKAEYSVEYLNKLCKRGRLNLQPDFQRRFVWDAIKASSLIESLLLDVPIPVIYLAEDIDGVFSVIDGQQRLNSIFSFIDGKFPDGKFFNLLRLNILRQLNGKCYRNMDAAFQEKLDSATLSTVIIKKESDPDLKFDIFERLNTGAVKLNDQELRNCMFRGNYLNLAKELSADSDFRYIIGLKGPDNRMKDVEYVLRFGAFYHQTYLKYSQSMKVFLNHELQQYQNMSSEQEEDFKAQFKKAVQINHSLFGNRSFRKIMRGDESDPNAIWKVTKVVNSALYDLMMVSFLQYDKNMIYRNMDAVREAYIWLMSENQSFIDAVEKWTNSPENVRTRFETFNKILRDIFNNDSKQPRCFSREIKESLFKLNNSCSICGQQILMVEDAAVDHVEEYWLGGKTIPNNARLTHRYCNMARKRKE